MAYGRKKGTGRARGRMSRGRAPRRAVKVPKKKKTARSYTRSNALAVNRLSRKIESVRMAAYGSIQRNFVKFADIMTVSETRPILWDIMDFSKEESASNIGGLVYQQDAAGAVAGATHWQVPPTLATNPFHDGYNNDSVGSGKYLAISATTVIKLEGRPNLSNARVRVQVFGVKATQLVPNTSTAPLDNMILPSAMSNFHHMATPTFGNYLPSNRFKTYVDKWCYLNSSKTNADIKGTSANTKYIRFTIKPQGGKLCIQQFTLPNIQGNQNVDDFGPTNIPLGQPLWCLISCDDSSADADRCTVDCSTVRTWRDPTGQY